MYYPNIEPRAQHYEHRTSTLFYGADFLSNFWPRTFPTFPNHVVGDTRGLAIAYEAPTTEHLYQALKFPRYPDVQRRILEASTPEAAKQLAHDNRRRIVPSWAHTKLRTMTWVIFYKWLSHPAEAHARFEPTHQSPLVENSPTDDYWGAPLTDQSNPHAPPTLYGRNALGEIWMAVRQAHRDALLLRRARFTLYPTHLNLKLLGHYIGTATYELPDHGETRAAHPARHTLIEVAALLDRQLGYTPKCLDDIHPTGATDIAGRAVHHLARNAHYFTPYGALANALYSYNQINHHGLLPRLCALWCHVINAKMLTPPSTPSPTEELHNLMNVGCPGTVLSTLQDAYLELTNDTLA